MLASQVGEGEVATPVPVHAERGPELRDDPDLGVERGPRQAVLGDAVAEHSAGERVGIEERAGVALLEEVEGGGEPGRPGADDRDALPGGAAGRGSDGLAASRFRSAAWRWSAPMASPSWSESQRRQLSSHRRGHTRRSAPGSDSRRGSAVIARLFSPFVIS